MKLIPDWNVLQKVGNTKFVQSMYVWIFVVPMLAKAFEYIQQDSMVFVVFEQQIKIGTSLPFSWVMFYFCAVFLALGNLLLLATCPKIVKDHPTYQSYAEEGKTLKQLAQYSEDIKFNWGDLAKSVDKRIKDRIFAREMGHDPIAKHYSNLDVDDPVHYFWPIYEFANPLYKIRRFACLLLLTTGFGLFTIVAVQNFMAVVEFLSK